MTTFSKEYLCPNDVGRVMKSNLEGDDRVVSTLHLKMDDMEYIAERRFEMTLPVKSSSMY